MKIYVDIGHPAYFHFMRNFIRLMNEKGHSFYITARDKDVTFDLLKTNGITAFSRGKGSHSSVGRLFYAIAFLLKNIRAVKRFRPDICISIGSPYMVMIAWLIGTPGIIFEDTELGKKDLWIYRWFADVIFTLSNFKHNLGTKQIRCNSYKELAYLHHKYYQPDLSIFQLLHITKTEKYVLVRFVSHQVSHDKPDDGLTPEMKEGLICELSASARIFVSTEKGMNPQFPELELQIPPERMHDVIAFSQLVIGESATMAAEAAVLGVPSIFLDNHGRGYADELEKTYKMVSNYPVSPSAVENALNKAKEILNVPDYLKTRTLHHLLEKDKIDVTAFMIWFVENYPDSARVMREEPEYQYRFR